MTCEELKCTLSKYYPTGYDMTEDEWLSLNSGGKLNNDQKEIKQTTIGIQGKAETIITEMKIFTFPSFEKQFYSNRINKTTSLLSAFDARIADLKKEKRIGTAEAFSSAKNSLLEFRKKFDYSEHKEYYYPLISKNVGI